MKAIDLYKMVAVDKAPVKIKYLDRYYEYHKSVHDYYYSGEGWLFDNLDELNEEVEIIEDTPKEDKIQQWGKLAIEDIKKINKVSDLKEYVEVMVRVQNEIIDKINGE